MIKKWTWRRERKKITKMKEEKRIFKLDVAAVERELREQARIKNLSRELPTSRKEKKHSHGDPFGGWPPTFWGSIG